MQGESTYRKEGNRDKSSSLQESSFKSDKERVFSSLNVKAGLHYRGDELSFRTARNDQPLRQPDDVQSSKEDMLGTVASNHLGQINSSGENDKKGVLEFSQDLKNAGG